MIEAVIKVGGSLSRTNSLRELCVLLGELGRRRRLLVVPGGGPFADAVRVCDATFGLSDAAAHWMAILAMDQLGFLLADLVPESEPVRDADAARQTALAGKVPVLLPFDLLRRTDPLPHSWEVTSDSIGAWVAGYVGAPAFVLLKSTEELPEDAGPEGGNGVGPVTVTLEQLARWEGVDPYLTTVLPGSGLDLWIVNGNRPDRLRELLEKGSTRGAHWRR